MTLSCYNGSQNKASRSEFAEIYSTPVPGMRLKGGWTRCSLQRSKWSFNPETILQ